MRKNAKVSPCITDIPSCTQAIQKTDRTLNALDDQKTLKKRGAISLKPEVRVIATNSRHNSSMTEVFPTSQ